MYNENIKMRTSLSSVSGSGTLVQNIDDSAERPVETCKGWYGNGIVGSKDSGSILMLVG